MHTPLSDTVDGEFGKDSSKKTPLAADGHRQRVASFLGSKIPIVERELRDMGIVYSGVMPQFNVMEMTTEKIFVRLKQRLWPGRGRRRWQPRDPGWREEEVVV